MFERVADRYRDWKNRQIMSGVRSARLSLCEGFEIHLPAKQTRIEERAFNAFKHNYLHKSIQQVQKERAAQQAFQTRLAYRQGYQEAGTMAASLVTYLESLGADVPGEEEAVEITIRVIDGYRARNDLLEAARIESDEIIANLEADKVTLAAREKKARQSAWESKSELTMLKDQHAAAAGATGAIPVASRTGSRPLTESIRTVRVPGVDQTAR